MQQISRVLANLTDAAPLILLISQIALLATVAALA